MQHAIATAAPFRDDDFRSTDKPRGRSIHGMPASFSAAYFSAALVTDLIYWQVPNVIWERFSLWLINAFVHSRDGYTAVVPTGLMLSGVVVVVLLLAALPGMTLPNRSRAGG